MCVLQSLYDNIKKEAFKVPEDDGSDITRTFFNPDNEGFLTKEGIQTRTTFYNDLSL